jgi:MFS family permease
MPDLSSLAEGLRTTLGGTLAIVAGALLLLFGRRLYWLFAAVVGFVAVFLLTGTLAPQLSESTALFVAVAAGLVGAVVTVFAHKILLSLIGGVAGGLIALWQIQVLGVEQGIAWLLAALLGAVVGAWLVSSLFDFALVLLSSLLGAQLLLDAWPVDPGWFLPAYCGLVALGLFFQLIRSRRRSKKRKET